jgi:serine/threonine-protein kinase SRPK3
MTNCRSGGNKTWHSMDNASPEENSGYTLLEWLEEIYFDEERTHDLTQDDILKVGKLVQSMLKFEPSRRASATEIIQDSLFKENRS